MQFCFVQKQKQHPMLIILPILVFGPVFVKYSGNFFRKTSETRALTKGGKELILTLLTI